MPASLHIQMSGLTTCAPKFFASWYFVSFADERDAPAPVHQRLYAAAGKDLPDLGIVLFPLCPGALNRRSLGAVAERLDNRFPGRDGSVDLAFDGAGRLARPSRAQDDPNDLEGEAFGRIRWPSLEQGPLQYARRIRIVLVQPSLCLLIELPG